MRAEGSLQVVPQMAYLDQAILSPQGSGQLIPVHDVTGPCLGFLFFEACFRHINVCFRRWGRPAWTQTFITVTDHEFQEDSDRMSDPMLYYVHEVLGMGHIKLIPAAEWPTMKEVS